MRRKQPTHNITSFGEPFKLVLTKNKKKEETTMKMPQVEDDNLRFGSHYIHENSIQNHRDGYKGKKKDKSMPPDRITIKNYPPVAILSGENGNIFLTDHCDMADILLLNLFKERPALIQYLKRR